MIVVRTVEELRLSLARLLERAEADRSKGKDRSKGRCFDSGQCYAYREALELVNSLTVSQDITEEEKGFVTGKPDPSPETSMKQVTRTAVDAFERVCELERQLEQANAVLALANRRVKTEAEKAAYFAETEKIQAKYDRLR